MPGEAARDPGSTASVAVTAATGKCVVPRLKGHTLAGARRLLSSAHCSLGKVISVHSAAVPKGLVLRSSPGAGTSRKAGSKIVVYLSSGPKSSSHGKHRVKVHIHGKKIVLGFKKPPNACTASIRRASSASARVASERRSC